jgi:ABC-2 type transport system permease protein
VFLMGFTFGILIWLPVLMRKGTGGPTAHYLTAVTVYGLMLLGEVCIWNMFGFDRSAAQSYFVMPVKLSTVIVAKNITAVIFIALEAISITAVCAVLRMPVTAIAMVEAISVTLTFALFLLAIGNMISVRNPRAIDPEQSWRRSSAGRVQAFLIFIYLLVALPVSLAYLARYAFDSELAFYFVLAIDAGLAAVVYSVALDSALTHASANRESIITALSQGQGPVA